MAILTTDGNRAHVVEGIYKLQIQKAPRGMAGLGPNTQASPKLPGNTTDVYGSTT